MSFNFGEYGLDIKDVGNWISDTNITAPVQQNKIICEHCSREVVYGTVHTGPINSEIGKNINQCFVMYM